MISEGIQGRGAYVNSPIVSKRLTLGVWGMALALVLIARGQTSQKQAEITPSTIVFVCEHGSGKSVIAAAHFNRLASEKGLPYRAVSRGTKPEEAVSDAVKSGLAKEGMDVDGWTPKAISDEDIRRASRVVSIATDLPEAKPSVKNKLLEWNDVPPLSENYEASRAALVQRVGKLVESLAANRK
jgi:protein-tyrosine-phosphatase